MINRCSPFPCKFLLEKCYTYPKRALTTLFQVTIGPFIGLILKISLFREAYLNGRISKYFILPFVKSIGNLWFRVQGLGSQFISFDEARLKRTELELLRNGRKEEIHTEDNRRVPLYFFEAERDRKPQCVLYLSGFGLPFQTSKKLIQKHLEEGVSFAVFEYGKKASVEGFVQDADAAYKALLRRGIQPKNIKVLGYCGTTYIAAYLKLKYHCDGLDAILVNPHTSLRDVVRKVNRLGLLGLGRVVSPQYEFDNEKLFSQLGMDGGSTCLVIDPNNSITPADTIQRLQAALSNTNSRTIEIREKFNKQFENPVVWDSYLNFLLR